MYVYLFNTRVQMNGPLGQMDVMVAVVEKAMSPMRKQRFQSMNEMLQAIAAINGSTASEDTVLEDEDTDYEQPATHAQPVNIAQPIETENLKKRPKKTTRRRMRGPATRRLPYGWPPSAWAL